MTALTIVKDQNRLHEKLDHYDPVHSDFSHSILQGFIDDMLETMRAERGIGLAANQVGEPFRICVIGLDNHRPPLVMVNPYIYRTGGRFRRQVEGCLSIPGKQGTVRRYEKVWVIFADRRGKPQSLRGVGGRLAHVIQHELDHLDGVLYIDKLEDDSELRNK